MDASPLIQIYRCLCDETRLRIVHLLKQGPLCVCHFQTVLQLPQVTISKHLAYLREHGLAEAHRHEQWMIYRLPQPTPRELGLQLSCLQDCVETHPVFREDLKRLRAIASECCWIEGALPAAPTRKPRVTDRCTKELSPQAEFRVGEGGSNKVGFTSQAEDGGGQGFA